MGSQIGWVVLAFAAFGFPLILALVGGAKFAALIPVLIAAYAVWAWQTSTSEEAGLALFFGLIYAVLSASLVLVGALLYRARRAARGSAERRPWPRWRLAEGRRARLALGGTVFVIAVVGIGSPLGGFAVAAIFGMALILLVAWGNDAR
jgi:hypothetical protein